MLLMNMSPAASASSFEWIGKYENLISALASDWLRRFWLGPVETPDDVSRLEP